MLPKAMLDGTLALLPWLCLIALPVQCAAVEVAPRISDREIVEALSGLKAGQKSLEKRLDDVNKRIDDLRAQMKSEIQGLRAEMKSEIQGLRAEMKSEIQGLRAEMKSEIQGLRAETETGQKALEKRIDDLWTLTMVLLAGILGLIGFVVWDRKTALRPLEQRLLFIEHELHEDLEAQRAARSEVNRILKALRLLADEDERVARILKQCSLL